MKFAKFSRELECSLQSYLTCNDRIHQMAVKDKVVEHKRLEKLAAELGDRVERLEAEARVSCKSCMQIHLHLDMLHVVKIKVSRIRYDPLFRRTPEVSRAYSQQSISVPLFLSTAATSREGHGRLVWAELRQPKSSKTRPLLFCCALPIGDRRNS